MTEVAYPLMFVTGGKDCECKGTGKKLTRFEKEHIGKLPDGKVGVVKVTYTDIWSMCECTVAKEAMAVPIWEELERGQMTLTGVNIVPKED